MPLGQPLVQDMDFDSFKVAVVTCNLYGIIMQRKACLASLGKQHLHLFETSLLRRLQAQTLPNATQPVGKIHPFNKIAVNFDPIQQF